MRFICFCLFLFAFSTQAVTIDIIDSLRQKAVSECSSSINEDQCLVGVGRALSVIESLPDNDLSILLSLCSRNSSSQSVILFKCIYEQVQIASKNPFPEFSSTRLLVDKMRPYWISICKNTSSQIMSDCVESQQQQFEEIWNIYLELPHKDPLSLKRFKSCTLPFSIDKDWAAVNRCLKR